MRKILLVLLIATIVVAGIFCPSASARYAENTGVEPGDTLFIGEQGLDFSRFSTATLTVDSMVMQSGGSIADMIPLIDEKGSIGTSIKSGIYLPYNGTTPLNTGMCKITTLESVIGSILVTPADGSTISSAQPEQIPKGVGVIFSVTGGDISTLETQLSGNWNKMTLKNTETSQSTSIIKNLVGSDISLSSISTPSNPDLTYAFKLGEQTTVVPSSGQTSLELSFQISLNGVTADTKYDFTATSSTLQIIVPSAVQIGNTETITFTGVTGSTYKISLPENGPTFINTGNDFITFINGSYLLVTPGWDGIVLIPVTAEPDVILGPYLLTVVNTFDSREQISSELIVEASEMKLIFDQFNGDILTGVFPIGDPISFGGTISNAPMQRIPIYLFVTGRGLPENGVNLHGEQIIDGNPETFTIAYYNPLFAVWDYKWTDTNKFAPGTYTIHVNFEPYGFTQSTTPGTNAYVNHLSQEISLTDLSIHVRFSESNNGLFTQGDYLYSYWIARGSPNHVRWYIVGTNFLYTGLSDRVSNTPVTSGSSSIDASRGDYGFTYPRNFTMEIDPGNYFLIYQHPGVDDTFDVYPDIDNGVFTTLQTTFGESANVGSMPSENAAYTLKELISKSFSDDLYVVSEFIIEEPYININQEDTIEIGDTLIIQGTTNYAASDKTADDTNVGNTFSLLINRLDFELTEENAAMALQIVPRTGPEIVIPYTGERTFSFDEIDTSTWFEGTYEAVVTNINTGFSASMTFNVVGEGVVKDSTNIDVSANPLEEPDYIIEPLPEIPDYTEPEEPKSPGFILAPLALGLAVILRRK